MFATKLYFQVPTSYFKCLFQHDFEDFQGWWHNHFPGQPVSMLDYPLSEEVFPNIQPKHPIAKSWGYFLLFCHLLLEKREISHCNLLPGSCTEQWGPPSWPGFFPWQSSLSNTFFLLSPAVLWHSWTVPVQDKEQAGFNWSLPVVMVTIIC